MKYETIDLMLISFLDALLPVYVLRPRFISTPSVSGWNFTWHNILLSGIRQQHNTCYSGPRQLRFCALYYSPLKFMIGKSLLEEMSVRRKKF